MRARRRARVVRLAPHADHDDAGGIAERSHVERFPRAGHRSVSTRDQLLQAGRRLQAELAVQQALEQPVVVEGLARVVLG